MVTAKTATFEELTKLATDFVTAQKGMWDHAAWVDFVSSVQGKGFDISAEMQSNLGGLLEAMKRFHAAAGSTESIESAMRTIANDSATFIKRQNGVWGHAEWEEFMKTIQRNTLALSEGTAAYLGGVLESMKVVYSLSPALPVNQSRSPAPKRPASSPSPELADEKTEEAKRPEAKPTEVMPTEAKRIQMKPAERKVEKKPSGKKFDKQDDLMAIAGIGPALAKKLNAEGILSYKQLAALSNEDVANLDPKFKGRIKRDDWVGQAKKLSQE